MSKNITIKEGGSSRSFTAEKLRTNLQGGGTCDWVPVDEVDSYVQLEELSVTENGIYYPTEKVGISKVTVDVQGQGGGGVVPSGTTVRGVAAENLTAGDCVYIVKGGSGGVAPFTPTSLTGLGQMYMAYDGQYVYYKRIAQANVYRIPYRNLTATPELYESVDNAYLSRHIYQNGTTAVVKNLKTGATNSEAGFNDHFARWSSANYMGFPNVGFARYTDLVRIPASGSWQNFDNYTLAYDDNHYIYKRYNDSYKIYTNGTAGPSISFSSAVAGFNIIGEYLVLISNTAVNNEYEIYYCRIGEGTLHSFSGSGLKSTMRDVYPKFNADGTILLFPLGDNGLAMIYSDLSYAVYSNIKSNSNTLFRYEMLGDYFFDCVNNTTYFVPQGTTIGKTNDKNHAGSLGFVQVDIPAGAEGNAIEMFR